VPIKACRAYLRQKRAESRFHPPSPMEKSRYDCMRPTIVVASIRSFTNQNPAFVFHPLLDPSIPLITSRLVLFLVFCNISATEFGRTNHQISGTLAWVGFWINQVVGSELRI
jgi:hypothetical protein